MSLYHTLDANLLLESGSVLPFQGYSLSNEVHPAFRPKNFSKVKNYAALLPVLRLASHFLTCEAAMRHWYTVCHDKVRAKKFPKGSGLESKYFESVAPIRGPLTKSQLARMQQDLIDLAEFVTFRENPDDDCDTEGACRSGRRRESAGNSAWRARATIFYWARDYQYFVTSGIDTYANSQDAPMELWERCSKFSSTLYHELAYAIDDCHRHRKHEDLVLGHNTVTEKDFDFENEVFGGMLWNDSSLLEWPAPSRVRDYLRSKDPIFVTGPMPDGLDLLWQVPSSWTKQLFMDSFWQTVVPNKGVEALKVPRVLSAICEEEKCPCAVCTEHVRKGLFKGADVRRFMRKKSKEHGPDCVANKLWLVEQEEGQSDERMFQDGPMGYTIWADGSMVPTSLQHMVKEVRRELVEREKEAAQLDGCSEAEGWGKGLIAAVGDGSGRCETLFPGGTLTRDKREANYAKVPVILVGDGEGRCKMLTPIPDKDRRTSSSGNQKTASQPKGDSSAAMPTLTYKPESALVAMPSLIATAA